MTKPLPNKEGAEMVLSFECPRCNHRVYVSMEHIFQCAVRRRGYQGSL